jgi:hypothetical protein
MAHRHYHCDNDRVVGALVALTERDEALWHTSRASEYEVVIGYVAYTLRSREYFDSPSCAPTLTVRFHHSGRGVLDCAGSAMDHLVETVKQAVERQKEQARERDREQVERERLQLRDSLSALIDRVEALTDQPATFLA